MENKNSKKINEIKERNIEWKTIKQENERSINEAKKDLLLKRAAFIEDYTIPMLKELKNMLEV